MSKSDVDQKIIAAFAKLAGIYGYKGTTTRKIAQEAGINESTIFRHFTDKKGILRSLIMQYTNEITKVSHDFTLTGNSEKDIQHVVSIYQYFIEQHKGIFLIALRENRQFPELMEAIGQLITLQRNLYTKLFEKMHQHGEIADNINIAVEVNNFLLLNFGHSVFKLAYSGPNFQISDQDYLTKNIKVFTSHLRN
ncbi:TetR/AcrR family transcriptional regulator [Lactobacillus sp. ESL0679]|uniref:TetR/AcrR family transcriptional regulator n=1 Tax=Lactobacillus sp. ESL0679 TaxID=2983209 RepID=UPI0023F744DB|nr:TetR/AcrR family transcriptional regulator [Lactobacillus sp. ESL0679]MDF7683430.1 TetR/AcrR family transcriptional regulator [Lactobacillus sp. ESL0679]